MSEGEEAFAVTGMAHSTLLPARAIVTIFSLKPVAFLTANY